MNRQTKAICSSQIMLQPVKKIRIKQNTIGSLNMKSQIGGSFMLLNEMITHNPKCIVPLPEKAKHIAMGDTTNS